MRVVISFFLILMGASLASWHCLPTALRVVVWPPALLGTWPVAAAETVPLAAALERDFQAQRPLEAEWKRVESGSFVRLTGVHFLNEQHGYICGNNGMLMETRDAGANWFRVKLKPLEKNELVRDVWAFNPLRVLILGEYNLSMHPSTDMLYSRSFLLFSDAAETEEWRNFTESWHNYWGARPVNPPRRKARGKAPGVNPRQDDEIDDEEVERVTDPVIVRFSFVNQNTGWMVGESGMIQRTDKGGIEWKMQYANPRRLLYDVHPIDEKQVWIVGASGTIIRTSDGGETWQDVLSPTTNTLRAVHFVGAQNGWAVGANGTILKGTSTGRLNKEGELVMHWEAITPPTKETLNDVFFTSPQEGWVCGEHATLLHSTDGGRTWEEAVSRSYVRPYVHFTRLFFLHSKNGWVVGSNGNIFSYNNRPVAAPPSILPGEK